MIRGPGKIIFALAGLAWFWFVIGVIGVLPWRIANGAIVVTLLVILWVVRRAEQEPKDRRTPHS